MNQNALYSPDLGACFTYSKRIRATHTKFSTGFWSQSLHQKLAQGGMFGRASETWISKNPLESHFSFNKKCFVGRTVMNQNALYFPDLGECFTYSERMHTTHRKFSMGFFRVDFLNSSLGSSAKLQNILSFCASFWQRLWLQKPVKNFSYVVRIRSEYVKHSPSSGKYNALWFMTVRPTKHFLWKEKWLSSGFLKFKSLKLCQAPHSVWVLAKTDFRSP